MPPDSTESACTDACETSTTGKDLLPVRMLNEYAYCPRLYHLMHVEGRWEDNAFTIEGRVVHRRVDQLDHVLPDAQAATGEHTTEVETATPRKRGKRSATPDDGHEPPTISRSVPLGSDLLGLTAKLDLVSTAPGPDGIAEAVPVETKRGRVPNNPERSWEPERVQLMAQGLLLREHGYRSDHGVLYFAGSRTRVDVPFSPELENHTRDLIRQAHQAADATIIPLPLEDSRKCNGCSLNGICLPDETLALKQLEAPPTDLDSGTETEEPHIRRLYPARDNALPLYVQEQGAMVGKSGENLIVRKEKEEIGRARLKDTSQVVLCGNIQISTQTIHLLCEADVPVVYLSSGHWFYGVTQGITLRNAYDRAAQFELAAQPGRCLAFARDLVIAKGTNQRTMLRRNATGGDRKAIDFACSEIAELTKRVPTCPSIEQLLGLEGLMAVHYFRHFSQMLRPRDFDACWDFQSRNRRPPRDPVNALLSFGYALLAKEWTVSLLAEGLDPWWGLYHQPRHGRPSLALDLMEPTRPLIVDSAVITAVNTGMVTARDFTMSRAGCILTPGGRKAFLRAYESRLDQLVTHPLFGYRCSWRAIIRVQARLFSRWLRGDVPRFESITTR